VTSTWFGVKKTDNLYAFNCYFNDMLKLMDDKNLNQLVNFPTWSRIVNDTNRESIIDVVYSSNPTSMTNSHGKKPYFGDHLIIMLDFESTTPKAEITSRRFW
jgi:hypothetical protein